jgi:hypothetical protein
MDILKASIRFLKCAQLKPGQSAYTRSFVENYLNKLKQFDLDYSNIPGWSKPVAISVLEKILNKQPLTQDEKDYAILDVTTNYKLPEAEITNIIEQYSKGMLG